MKIVRLFISIFLCLAAGFLGSIFTTPYIPTWYANINKPSFNPPDWVFAPIWTTLFILMGISAFLIWNRGFSKKENRAALSVFVVQLIFNVLWSFLFFKFQSPLLAFFDIVILWILILLTIVKFYKIYKAAGLLLVPYLLWVSFASVLNFFVYLLNR